MRFLILSLIQVSTFIFVLSTPAQVQPRVETNDFIVRLILNISEEKVDDYLIEVIFERAIEKGVEPEHVLQLFQVGNLTLDEMMNVLEALNIPSSTVFSLNGLSHTLEALTWTFTNFYNALTTSLGLSGTPLRDALVALQVDVANFSSGITWGDPDPWSEFIKGTFTQESIRLATEAAGTTIEGLFDGVKDLIAEEVGTWEIEKLIQTLVDHSIGQPEAVIIWNALNITLEDVNNVELFKNILGNFSERINSQTSLGILTDENTVFIHRRTYDLFDNQVELVDIYAETLLTNVVLTISEINETIYRNVVVLSFEELPAGVSGLTTAEIGYADEDLADCTYLTLQNNVLFSVFVEEAVFDEETFVIPRNTVNEVILGSALVCNDTVYGLARELVGQTIILDAFDDFGASGGNKFGNYKWLNGLVLVTAWAFTCIFSY